MSSKQRQSGFTLIETLVALGIAAVALTALAGRLGISADMQRTLLVHATMLEVATNLLQEQRLKPSIDLSDRNGEVEARGMTLRWKMSTEKTVLDALVRQNVVVSAQNEPDVSLFMYHVKD